MDSLKLGTSTCDPVTGRGTVRRDLVIDSTVTIGGASRGRGCRAISCSVAVLLCIV